MKKKTIPFLGLRHFLRNEPDEGVRYFSYSATLRISGFDLDFEKIESELELKPKHKHRKGEKSALGFYESDMWSFQTDTPEGSSLENHINSLWEKIKTKKEFLLNLKEKAKVDVFLGYTSNVDTAGIEIPHTSLEIFRELEIPFGLSIIVG